jgi:hypothetical protein
VRAALAAVLVVVATAHATDVVPMPFARVVAGAGTIVHGTVTAVRSGRDEAGLPATWVTLAVHAHLKGPDADTLVVKQLGVHEPLADGTLLHVPGLPRLVLGEEYVLFLHAPSRRGFTSPVGLAQGVYRVDRRGPEVMVRPGPDRAPRMRLDGFLAAVRGQLLP